MNVTNIRPLREHLARIGRILLDIRSTLLSVLNVRVVSAANVAVTSMPTTTVTIGGATAMVPVKNVSDNTLPMVTAAHAASSTSFERMAEV